MNKIKVMVVDDSPFNRKMISEMLESSDRIEVVAKAFDGEDAIRKIIQFNPDVVTLDLEMPRLDGFAVLRWMMANRPIPVLVVSARESNRSIFKALDLGAVDFVVKPSRTASPKLKELEIELVNKILSIPSVQFEHIKDRISSAPEIKTPTPLPQAVGEHDAEVVAIAASTGGPPAIQQIITSISKQMVSPIVICQHMPPIFTRLFAERLAGLSGRIVKEAVDGEALFPGHTYVAPGGSQMRLFTVEGGRHLSISSKGPDDRFAPSANVLLSSVAKICGRRCLAAVLTGMGDDGKEGALAIRKAGGKVIAESESTAVIYGMPKEVVKAGGADFVVRIEEVAGLVDRFGLVQGR